MSAGAQPAPAAREDRAVLRRLLLTLAVLRFAIPIAMLPLIPVMLGERFLLLLALRPGKELLLLGGGRARISGDPAILELWLAAFPFLVAAVWVFFALGRLYREALRTGDGPAWLHRAVPADRLALADRILAKRGPAIAVLGRIATIPPTVLAAAAGASDVPARRYLAADFVGAVAGFGTAVGAGYVLGRAYEDGGPWLTGAGVAFVVVLVLLLTRWIQREAEAMPAEPDTGAASPQGDGAPDA
ncbi:DedA family protein [Egicoccus sp. AB-alg2]|uniref:DedA family protein n=1 Tax=Egicoccus sp. AB-alg2 TaxID=3242693 RepID=UPI00359CFD25